MGYKSCSQGTFNIFCFLLFASLLCVYMCIAFMYIRRLCLLCQSSRALNMVCLFKIFLYLFRIFDLFHVKAPQPLLPPCPHPSVSSISPSFPLPLPYSISTISPSPPRFPINPTLSYQNANLHSNSSHRLSINLFTNEFGAGDTD